MESVRISEEPRVEISVTEEYKNRVTDEADNRDLARSALLRMWLFTGERVEKGLVPKVEKTSTQENDTDPIEQIFLAHLPDSEEEAVEIDELREEIKNKVNNEVMRVFRESDKVKLSQNGEVYQDA